MEVIYIFIHFVKKSIFIKILCRYVINKLVRLTTKYYSTNAGIIKTFTSVDDGQLNKIWNKTVEKICDLYIK